MLVYVKPEVERVLVAFTLKEDLGAAEEQHRAIEEVSVNGSQTAGGGGETRK